METTQETTQKTTKKKATSKANQVKHKSFAEAMSAAQVELTDPIKNQLNTYHKNGYVDLATLLGTIRPVLAKHGLSIRTAVRPYMQEVSTAKETTHNGQTQVVTTTTTEPNGHFIEAVVEFGDGVNIATRKSEIYIPKQEGGAQKFAGMHTYARRWLLAGLCAVGEMEDDDGQNAAGLPIEKPSQNKRDQIINQARR